MSTLAIVICVVWGLCLLCLWSAFRSRGLLPWLRRMVAAVAFGALGTVLGTLLFVLQAFDAFSQETLIARVTTRWSAPKEFELAYTPVASRSAAPAVRVRLEGDQWGISGGIIKWHPWLTALGLPSYQKPLRLAGQFSNLHQARVRLPSLYPLAPTADQWWETFYRLNPYLPFIDAVYEASAYVYVEPSVAQEIYVTPSGYLIKRKPITAVASPSVP